MKQESLDMALGPGVTSILAKSQAISVGIHMMKTNLGVINLPLRGLANLGNLLWMIKQKMNNRVDSSQT